MSITDELREYAHDCCARVDDAIHAIADRIDAEHERECKEQYACGVEHGIGASIDASMIQTHGYVELPKDADGEYINAGDKLDGYGKTIEVVELRYGRSGWVLISRDGNGYADTYAFSHRQPDSWERIIDDAEALAREWFNTDMSENEHADGLNALVARCKKLAGDAS